LRSLHEITLRADEVEALRLYNLKELSQTESAEQMKISQPTFARIINRTYHKIAKALIEGYAIRFRRASNSSLVRVPFQVIPPTTSFITSFFPSSISLALL